ncbi:hypothetical protein AK830_g2214 [Neonectria ditissima]|uniref:Uncharacterized protein n=1 Tax=Neonectria ditissima TaxID=78410 RepID=A0A0P7BSM4_9HYPO|nr:hypothetical protein AK830_g2214 [Neonectria ditissima]
MALAFLNRILNGSFWRSLDDADSRNSEELADERGSSSPSFSQATPRPKQDAGVSDGRDTRSRSPSLARDTSLDPSPEEHGKSYEVYLREQMEQEKTRYPGASGWAPAEERLFEILYLRQDLPMLPPTWDIDFRGVPISEVIFDTCEDFPPIIYAHSKDFRATSALMRLIDLTSRVRANVQTGFRRKTPGLIKRELDKYLSWAAQDGDFAHLRIIPNIVTEAVDTTMAKTDISDYIQSRMHDLARLQREFLRRDRDPQFWEVVKPSIMVSPKVKLEPEDDTPMMDRWPGAVAGRHYSALEPDDTSEETPTCHRAVKLEDMPERRRLFASPNADADGLAEYPLEEEDSTAREEEYHKTQQAENDQVSNSSSPRSSPSLPRHAQTPPHLSYRRHPPVIYGLFIINTSVLVLTADSSLGDGAYVSFQVQANFQDQNQSVWNALTVAIPVCLARDELMTRVSDFEELPVVVESDPDV